MKDKKLALLLLLLLMGALLCGCNKEDSAPPKELTLRERSRSLLDLEKLAQQKFWVELMTITFSISLIAGLNAIAKGDLKLAGKWALLVVLAGAWIQLGQGVYSLLEQAWPQDFTQEMINEALGRNGGLVGQGDITPYTAPLVDGLISVSAMLMSGMHALVIVWFMFLPSLVVFGILFWGRHLRAQTTAPWFGLFLARYFLPRCLYWVALGIGAQRMQAMPNNPPAEVIATLKNTINQLNLLFAGQWLAVTIGIPFVLLALGFSMSFGGPAVVGFVRDRIPDKGKRGRTVRAKGPTKPNPKGPSTSPVSAAARPLGRAAGLSKNRKPGPIGSGRTGITPGAENQSQQSQGAGQNPPLRQGAGSSQGASSATTVIGAEPPQPPKRRGRGTSSSSPPGAKGQSQQSQGAGQNPPLRQGAGSSQGASSATTVIGAEPPQPPKRRSGTSPQPSAPHQDPLVRTNEEMVDRALADFGEGEEPKEGEEQ